MAVRITRTGVVLTVGIIIVAGLLIGGLLWVQQKGEQARREEAIRIAETQLESESSQDVAPDNSGGASAGNTDGQKDSENGASSGQSGGTSAQSTDELPETGIGDVAPLLIIGVLVFFVASYLQSHASKKSRG